MKRWIILGGAGFAVGIVAIVAVVIVIGRRVPTDDPKPSTLSPAANESTTTDNPPVFPLLRGTNLSFNEVTIPNDLDAGLKLIVVSYDRNQQPIVDGWLAPLEALNVNYPDLAGYYIPLLPKDAADSAAFIIGGFAALANENERERTIIVFTNVEGFNALVGVENLDNVQLFLLNADHAILWRTNGNFNAEKLAELEAALAAIPMVQ